MLRQLFLSGEFEEEIYMDQADGFVAKVKRVRFVNH
jgi:hypothetical protein